MKQLLLKCLFLFLSSAVFAQTGWTPELMIKFKRITGTALSPNGQLVAYEVATPTMDGEKSEFVTHIWMASATGKSNYQFTFGDKSCTSPRFSPDGRFLAFLSSRGVDNNNQIWVIRLSGGEAEQLTKSKAAVSSFSWAPDGKRIAYVMGNPETPEEEKAKKEKRDWTVVDKNYRYAHVYTTTVDRDEKGKRKMKRLTKGKFHVVAIDWSPDSKTIVFNHLTTPKVNDWPTSQISIVPADSGAVTALVTTRESAQPRYSPDGQWIAFTSGEGDRKWAGAFDTYIIPSKGGTPRKLAETIDRQPDLITWSADGKEIYYAEADRTSRRVFALPVSGAKPRVLTPGNGIYTSGSFSADKKTMAFIHAATEKLPNAHVTGLLKFEPVKVSDVNSDFPPLPMGKTEVVQWKSKDGKDVEGLLTYPVNYQAGKQYPLILNIHGGPAGVFTQTYTAGGATYPIQAFAQRGYAVLRANPRGSSGYGKDFRFANYNDWGFGDYEDLMTGIDKVIDMGVAHKDSLVVCGWSYGGFMTSFMVTKTNRFKAASVGAGVTNLMSFNGTADIPDFLPDYFQGDFWDRTDTYMKHSAMFNIKNVKTPSQVIHGERDLRVPISQGQEFYTALQRLGVPTEMIVYPRIAHSPNEPKFIQDIGERMIAWFDFHLGRKRSTTSAAVAGGGN